MAGAIDSPPLAVDTEIHPECDGGIAAKEGIGETLLPITVVEPQLHAPHLAIRHPIGRPGAKTGAGARALGQIGQVLQADALAVFTMAGSTGKVVRPAAHEEQALAHLVGMVFFRHVLCGRLNFIPFDSAEI
jgi:hypothetical protein